MANTQCPLRIRICNRRSSSSIKLFTCLQISSPHYPRVGNRKAREIFKICAQVPEAPSPQQEHPFAIRLKHWRRSARCSRFTRVIGLLVGDFVRSSRPTGQLSASCVHLRSHLQCLSLQMPGREASPDVRVFTHSGYTPNLGVVATQLWALVSGKSSSAWTLAIHVDGTTMEPLPVAAVVEGLIVQERPGGPASGPMTSSCAGTLTRTKKRE